MVKVKCQIEPYNSKAEFAITNKYFTILYYSIINNMVYYSIFSCNKVRKQFYDFTLYLFIYSDCALKMHISSYQDAG